MLENPSTPEQLLDQFGLSAFRLGQRDAVQAALAGRDSVVVMPTSAGKSLCYQLPALSDNWNPTRPLVVVVCPLIALMVDQWRSLQSKGISAVMLASTMPDDYNTQALGQIESGDARLVLATPERFGSHAFTAALDARRVTLFAVDEAHCIAQWGHDFRPEYLRLGEAIESIGAHQPRPPVMALTATATPCVTKEIAACLRLRDWLEVRSGFDRPNLTFDVMNMDREGARNHKHTMLLQVLGEKMDGACALPAIVYCGTRRETELVTRLLRQRGMETVAYHAGMSPADRRASQQAFTDSSAQVVVATSAFGMGIDKADVRTVVHWSIPTSLESYYQEAGRAGRDGAPARALLLASRVDLGRLIHFNTGRPSAGSDRGWESYRRIERFVFNASVCRRRQILEYFGDQESGAPTGRCCDVCEADETLREAIEDPLAYGASGGRRGDCGARRSRGAFSRVGAAGVNVAGANTQNLVQAIDESGFERLREWRRGRAKGKPAYMVAVNAVLEDALRTRPRNIDELLAVRGIGPVFCEKHGESLLRTLSDIYTRPVVEDNIAELPLLMRLANEAIDEVLGVATRKGK